MKKIVFIDRGNILRSPMAKGIYNFLKRDDSIAFAYGTNVVKQKREGVLLSDYQKLTDTISVLKNHGIDISAERCTQLLPEHLQDASKIIIMTEKEDIPEWLQKYEYEYWEVPNPDPVTKEVAEKEFDLLKYKISGLVIK